MTFKKWYEVHLTSFSDTWEQREYRYLQCGIGLFAFNRAIPEYLEKYKRWCMENKESVSIDI